MIEGFLEYSQATIFLVQYILFIKTPQKTMVQFEDVYTTLSNMTG